MLSKCIRCPARREESEDECSVCMQVVADDVHRTACGHTFHNVCIGLWDEYCVEKPFHCPMCRALLKSNSATAEVRRKEYIERSRQEIDNGEEDDEESTEGDGGGAVEDPA